MISPSEQNEFIFYERWVFVDEKNAIAVVEQPAEEKGTMMLWPQSCTRYMTSLGDGPEDVDRRVMALSAITDTLKGHVGEVIAVKDWFIHEVDRIDQATGETKRGPRLVLILADGTMIATSSAIVASTLGHLLSLQGWTSFRPAKKFLVGEGVGRNGKYLTLTPSITAKGK
jgi:hypothetical protein